MEPRILISRIKAHLANAPSFADYSPLNREQLVWLAQAHALAAKWEPLEALSLKNSSDFLSTPILRDSNLAQIFGVLHRAVANLELNLPEQSTQFFGPGAVYDFFKALNELIASASVSLMIVDPYLDAEIFDCYLSSVPAGVRIRLLIKNGAVSLKPAIEKFSYQRGHVIEARRSRAFHDRSVFVDGSDCWVIGQSIKDAARSMPTYLAPLSQDIALEKFEFYETMWKEAEPI